MDGGDACERPTLGAPKPGPEATHSVPGEAGRDHHIISECSRLKDRFRRPTFGK